MISIRRRLIGLLKSIIDYRSEQRMEGLGGHKVHSQSGADVSFRDCPGVNDCLQKGQIDYSVNLSGLGNQINELNWAVVTADGPQFVSEFNGFSALALRHRQLLLLIDENGEAYDMAGRKWSLAA